MVDERGAQARTHGAGVTGAIECRYYGRDFTAGEMALLRALIAGPPPLNRHMLSKEFCRRIGWFKPDGSLKDMMARVAMLAMHRDGLIALPAPQGRQNRPGPIVFGPDTEAPLFPAPTTLDKVRPLDLRPVVRGTRESKLWNEFVARYHYLGYKTLVGAQMRYAVHDRDGWPLAMLGFSTAAWKLAPRDNFIGWTRQRRGRSSGPGHQRDSALPLRLVPWFRDAEATTGFDRHGGRGLSNDQGCGFGYSQFKGRHGLAILGVVARPGRELAVAQSPQLAAQGLNADPDAELLPDPLHQVQQTPTDNAMSRRDRAALDHLNQPLALALVQLGRPARTLRIDQTLRAALVEAKYPVANRLQANAPKPSRVAARAAVIDLGQRQETTKLIRVARNLGQSAKRQRVEIIPKPNGRHHDKPP